MNIWREITGLNNPGFNSSYIQQRITGNKFRLILDPGIFRKELNMARKHRKIIVKVKMTKTVCLDQWHNNFQPMKIHNQKKKLCHFSEVVGEKNHKYNS